VKIYIVQLGDSLYKIAQKHGVSLEDLKKLNTHLTDPDHIKPGMKIKVPSDSKYVKKKVKADKIIKESPKKDVINKEMPIKENAIKENSVKENVADKKTDMKVKQNVKLEKKPVEKEETEKQLEENQLPMTNSKNMALAQSENNEDIKPMEAKEEQDLPMMEDPYPNAITVKESIDSTPESKWKLPDLKMGMVSHAMPNSSTVYEQGHHPYFHQQPFSNSSQYGKMKTFNQHPQPYYPFIEDSQIHYHQEQQGMGDGAPSVQPQMPALQQGMSSDGYGYASVPSPSHPQQGSYDYPGVQNGLMSGSGEQSFSGAMPATQPIPQMPQMGAGGQMQGGYGYPMSQVGQGQPHLSTLQPPSGLTELPHRDENPYSLWESYHNSINIPDFPKNRDWKS